MQEQQEREQGQGQGQENGAEGKQKRLTSASRSSLPRISEVFEDSEDMREAGALLKEAVKLKTKKSEIEERLEEIKLALAAKAMMSNSKGFRVGLAGFEYHGYKTRNTLDKPGLIAAMAEYGAPASLIADNTKPGKEFLSTEFVIFDLE